MEDLYKYLHVENSDGAKLIEYLSKYYVIQIFIFDEVLSITDWYINNGICYVTLKWWEKEQVKIEILLDTLQLNNINYHFNKDDNILYVNSRTNKSVRNILH